MASLSAISPIPGIFNIPLMGQFEKNEEMSKPTDYSELSADRSYDNVEDSRASRVAEPQADRSNDSAEDARSRRDSVIPEAADLPALSGIRPDGKKFFTLTTGKTIVEGTKEYDMVARKQRNIPKIDVANNGSMPSAAPIAYPSFVSKKPVVMTGESTTLAGDLEMISKPESTMPSSMMSTTLGDGSLQIARNPMMKEQIADYEREQKSRAAALARIERIEQEEKVRARSEGRTARSAAEIAAGTIPSESKLRGEAMPQVSPALSGEDLRQRDAAILASGGGSSAELAEAQLRVSEYTRLQQASLGKVSPVEKSASRNVVPPVPSVAGPSANINIEDGLSLMELSAPSANSGIIKSMRAELAKTHHKLDEVAQLDFSKIDFKDLSKQFGEGFAEVAKQAVKIAMEEISKSRN